MSSRVQPMLPRLPATPGKRVFGTAAAVDGMSRRADSSSPGVPILRGASSLIPRFLLLLLLLLLLHSVLFPRRRKKGSALPVETYMRSVPFRGALVAAPALLLGARVYLCSPACLFAFWPLRRSVSGRTRNRKKARSRVYFGVFALEGFPYRRHTVDSRLTRTRGSPSRRPIAPFQTGLTRADGAIGLGNGPGYA